MYHGMEYYKSLPLEHPGGQCYVVTAAARGHGSVVGSRGVILLDGGRMPVNDQMRFLKDGELLLQAASPVCHRLVRVVYTGSDRCWRGCCFVRCWRMLLTSY